MAIIRGQDVDATVRSAKLLFDCGIRVLEVTLTLPNAEEAIRQISSFVPEGAVLGAGTVLSEAQVDQAVTAGATFIVTPGISPSVGYAAANNLGVLAGAYTPTEIFRAIDLGVAAVKLFPASTLGPAYVKAVLEPLPDVAIIPVGGITTDVIPGYFAAGAAAVGVGGPLIGRAAQQGGDIEGLAQRASDFLRAVAQ